MKAGMNPTLVCEVGGREWTVDDGSRSRWHIADFESDLRSGRPRVRTLISQLAHRWGGGDFYNRGPNADTPPDLSEACVAELSDVDWESRSVRIVDQRTGDTLCEVPRGRAVTLAESDGDVLECNYGSATAFRRGNGSRYEWDRRIFTRLGSRFIQVPTRAGNVIIRNLAEGESDRDVLEASAAIAAMVNDAEDIAEWMHLWDTEGPLRSDSDPRRRWTETGGVFRAAMRGKDGEVASLVSIINAEVPMDVRYRAVLDTLREVFETSVRTGLPIRWTSEGWGRDGS